MNQISISNSGAPPIALPIEDLDRLRSQADNLAATSVGAGTRRAYNGAWRRFRGWCAHLRLDPFEAANVPLYVGHLAGRAFPCPRSGLRLPPLPPRIAGAV